MDTFASMRRWPSKAERSLPKSLSVGRQKMKKSTKLTVHIARTYAVMNEQQTKLLDEACCF